MNWLFSLLAVSFVVMTMVVIAVPFSFLWNTLAPIYLNFLPAAYQRIPFFHVVGLFLMIQIFRLIVVKDFIDQILRYFLML